MKIELHHLGEAHYSMIPNTLVPLKQHVCGHHDSCLASLTRTHSGKLNAQLSDHYYLYIAKVVGVLVY